MQTELQCVLRQINLIQVNCSKRPSWLNSIFFSVDTCWPALLFPVYFLPPALRLCFAIWKSTSWWHHCFYMWISFLIYIIRYYYYYYLGLSPSKDLLWQRLACFLYVYYYWMKWFNYFNKAYLIQKPKPVEQLPQIDDSWPLQSPPL